MSSAIEVWDVDAVTMAFTVAKSDGSGNKTLESAEAVAKSRSSGATVALATTNTTAADGKVLVRFDAGDLSQGIWQVQVRGTKGTDTQTVSERVITVRESFEVA